MNNRSVLITGATGILGGWVLGEALARGYEPTVLMRDANPNMARQRVQLVLRLVGHEDRLDDVKVICGDTRLPDFGLDHADVTRLRTTLGGVIHCAACTSFNPVQDAELWATNVGGVANVLRFLAGGHVPLYHVSTAFVAGKRRGRALETELDLNQGFRNTYERSKCESEMLVQEAISKGSIKASIFRPGIIVGATHQGRISQFLNFYGFMRIVDIASSGRLNGNRRLRFVANPNATKNLVPVDWTAKSLWDIVESQGPSLQTYHLTSPRPVVHTELQSWASDFLSTQSMSLEFTERLHTDVTTLERAANASLRRYRPYLDDEADFDQTNTLRALGGQLDFPELGPEFFLKLLSFARQQDWKGIFGCQTKSDKVADHSLNLPSPEIEALDSEVAAAVL